jgi:hypothetical protein
MDDVIRLPGLGPVIGGQVRYQLTLMLRTPRTLLAGLILPGALLAHVADGELTLPSADVTADLALLTGWARGNHVDLTGLEVGSPSLEDAYLALTTEGAGNHG